MSLEQLEKLIKNPFYKLNEPQLKRLEELRSAQIVKHSYEFDKTEYKFKKNQTKVDNEKTNRN